MGGSGWEMGCASERRIRLVSGFWISVPCKTHTLLIIEHSSKKKSVAQGEEIFHRGAAPSSLPPACAHCPLQQTLPSRLAWSHSKAPLFSFLAQG